MKWGNRSRCPRRLTLSSAASGSPTRAILSARNGRSNSLHEILDSELGRTGLLACAQFDRPAGLSSLISG
jgi:hypothetical protein